MRSRSLHLLLLAGGLWALAGCGSIHRPAPLTAAEAARLDRTGSLGVVAVEGDACKSWGRKGELHGMLERTGLFRRVVEPGTDDPAPDYMARIDERCSYRRGGWIPLWSVLTLGVIPTFQEMELGYGFTLHHLATGREVRIPCEIRTIVAVGWLPELMNVLPGWSRDDPEKTRNFDRRLAYAIASRIAVPAKP